MGMETTNSWKERLSRESEDERLPLHEVEDGDKKRAEEYVSRGGSWWNLAYLSNAALAMVSTRAALKKGFPYPICFLVTVQATMYSIILGVVILLRIKEFKKLRRKCDPGQPRSLREKMGDMVKLLVYFPISAAALICTIEAVALFPNLHVLAMLSICTYIMDAILLRIAYYSGLLAVDQRPTIGGLIRVLFASLCIFIIIYEDYRLSSVGLIFALAAYTLASLAKTISLLGPDPEHQRFHSVDCGLRTYLVFGIPTLLITVYSASQLEDTATAIQIARAWSIPEKLYNIAPAVMLQLIFRSSVNSAYRFRPDDAGGALEGNSPEARKAVALTLQSALLIVCTGAQTERNLVDWIQILAFIFLYFISVGPKHIGNYPPGVFRFMSRRARRKSLPINSERWQNPLVLLVTNLIFAIVLSGSVVYWCDTAGYNRDRTKWPGPVFSALSSTYQPPKEPQIEVVIAHSSGDSRESISDLISTFMSIPELERFKPHIKLYTKEASLNNTDLTPLVGDYDDRKFRSTVLGNVGGITATFLHHILNTWDTLPIQTLFLTTTNTNLALTKRRLSDYFITPGSPIPDALPKTGFLNLGDYASCSCNSCFDTHRWNDSFHLIPSMFGATRPGEEHCDSVLLTYGNNFFASAARIRDVKRDVWEMLYDALVNHDTKNAWAHDPNRMPKVIPGHAKVKVPWQEEGVYEHPDSLERPWLGFTVERLWGVMLQCSRPEVAWRCPNTWRGSRSGGEREDCSCLDWL